MVAKTQTPSRVRTMSNAWRESLRRRRVPASHYEYYLQLLAGRAVRLR